MAAEALKQPTSERKPAVLIVGGLGMFANLLRPTFQNSPVRGAKPRRAVCTIPQAAG